MNISFSKKQLRFSGPGGTLPVSDHDEVSRRLAMLILGQCEGKGATQAAKQFNFSRQRYYQLLDAFIEKGTLGLVLEWRGPKTDYRRTDQVIRLVIRCRFLDPEASPEVIAQKIRQQNFTISQRSVERIIADYGLQKKLYALNPAHPPQFVQTQRTRQKQRWIKEIDINPLFASSDDLVALDARVILHDPKTTEDHLPKLAIRPYPTQYAGAWKMKDGKKVTIRPTRPEDEPQMVKFHETLSERSVYLRYFSPLKLQQRVAHTRLVRICFNDYDREIALVAEEKGTNGDAQIVGVARLSKLHGNNAGEFAVVVTDRCQRKGLGTELTQRLVQIAKHEKLQHLVAYTLRENKDMQAMCKKVGFKVRIPVGESESVIEMDL